MQVIHIPRRFVPGEWGGTETFITEVSARLTDHGFTARIVTTKALDSHSEEVFRGIPIRRFSYFYPYVGLRESDRKQLDRKAGNLFSWSLLFALFRKRSIPADILHLHTGKRLGGIVRLCAKVRKIPYLVSLHGGFLSVPSSERQTWTDPTEKAFEWGKILGLLVGSRRVLDDASAIICVGDDEYQAMKSRYPDKRVVHLPNGVDMHRFALGDGEAFRRRYHVPSDAFVLLTVARVDEQKNQLSLITHLPHILRHVPNAHVLMIGPPTNPRYREKVAKEIERLELSDHVTMLDGFSYESEELVHAYHSADCFLLPSLHEPFGMVVLEAWASHLPVIVSHVGGLKHLVDDTLNGLAIDPTAPPEAADSLSSAVCLLAASTDLQRKLANAGFEKAASRYSWDHITEELVALYRSVCL